MQVEVVSTVTVLQQDPFMLFYQLEGIVIIYTHKFRNTLIITEQQLQTLPVTLCQASCLFTNAYLTDIVSTTSDTLNYFIELYYRL